MITAELMERFFVSPSFCGTWNRRGEVVVETGPPVENAVETGVRTFSRAHGSPQLRLGHKPLALRKLLNLQRLFVLIVR